MKNATKAALLSAFLGAGTTAYVHADGNMTVDQKLEKMTSELDLSATQRSRVRDILTEQKARKEAAATEQERQAVKEETRARVRAQLDDRQKALYDQMYAEKEKDRPAKPGVPKDAQQD